MVAKVAETAKSAEIADIDRKAKIGKVAEISEMAKIHRSGPKNLLRASKKGCNLKNWNDFLL